MDPTKEKAKEIVEVWYQLIVREYGSSFFDGKLETGRDLLLEIIDKVEKV